ncbi:immunoglobulin-like domain-containing protein [Aeromonas fluvialis]|uniref:immunoglobulin-like domain-containing protein n=1 Tax=Aeromonas fluvialis TaxID=591962 RepID=UPI0005A61B71|nr:immunoglobulin-like domain-containing protein [Aeromonas fluvialis]
MATTGTVTNTVVDDSDATTVTLSSATAGENVVEGGSIVYTASVNNPVAGSPLTVTLSNGVVITIPVGASSANSEPVPVRADDAYQQGNQALSVTIGGTSGGNYENVATTGTVTNTVVDDSDATTVTLTGDANVVEGGKANYTLTISDAPKTDLIVKVVVGHITTDNGDVQAVTRDVVIKEGETSVKFDVETLDDVYAEEAEQFQVSVSGTSGGGYEQAPALPNAVTTTITDEPQGQGDSVFAQIEVDKSSVAEGGALKYTVSLVDKDGNAVTLPAGKEVTLNLEWSGAAANDGDTSGRPASVTIGADGKAEFTVTTVNDTIYEGDEQLTASISGVKTNTAFEAIEINSTKGSAESIITDMADLPTVNGVVGDRVAEGNANTFSVSLSNASTSATTVNLTLAGGTAEKGVDFTGTTVTVVIGSVSQSVAVAADGSFSVSVPAGTTGFAVKVSTINDTSYEGHEHYSLTASANGSIASGSATIIDNDSVVALHEVVEGTAGNILNVADGVAFTGATALGGTVSLVNGKYVYQAPVRDHADSVADTDSFTYTKADGSTVTYTINILDTDPIAADDSGSVAVGLNVQTTGSASLLANDTVVDSSSANPAKVYSVTGLNGTAVQLGAAGSVTVAGKYGDLTVNANGSYTYTSKLDTDVQAVEGGVAVKSAFALYGFQNNSLPLNGSSLNLTGLTDSATALVDIRSSGNNAKPGIGVSQSGSGTNDIGGGESLVIGFKVLSNFAQIGINELNSGQGSASWKAYDAQGVLVGSGTLASSSSNGSLQSFNISTNTPFQYLVLGYNGNQNGYVIDSIKYTPAIGAVTEEFAYTVKDNDGDVSNSAVLTLNGNVPTTVAPTMLMGVEDSDVALTWASFGISDNASTVRISGNQNGTGTIRYLDASTNQYKELGKHETKTFTKADIDSGKVKFDPEDNVSGADVYGNDKGVGNKGHDLTSIKFDVLKGNQIIASDKSVVVDLIPQADTPMLKVGTFSSLAAMDFENVVVGSGGWKDNINPNSINGAGAIGQWKANGSGLIEVGKESVYLGNLATSTTNQVMEIESSRNVSQLYTDIQCESGRFYQLNFDISARTTDGKKIETCGLKVYMIQIVNGQPVSGERIELYDFSPQSVGWLKGVPVPLNVPETGTYRLVFESKDASGSGDSYGAVIDNVKFQAVDNKGYEDSFIKLGKIEAELVDKDGSERLSVEIEGLPVGAVLKDAANHIVIVKDDTHKVDVTGWSLSTLQLKVNDPGHYNLVVKATATEVTSSGTVLDSAVSKVILPVEVLPEGNTIKTGELNDAVYLSSDRPSVAANTAIEINGIHYSRPDTYQDGTAGVVINKDSADTVYTYGGNDHVEGGRGNDVVYLGNSGSNPANFNSAIDFVTADVASITLRPADGVAREDGDLIPAKASVAWGDVVQGAQGNDFLFGEDGVDLLFGGSGNDHLDGGKDRDFIRGGSGDDVILGGAGSDYLRGEEGADTFLWQQGDALEQGSNNASMTPDHAIDYITDFNVEHTSGWQQSSNGRNDFKSVDIAHSDKLDLSDMLDHSGSNLEGDLSKLLSAFEAQDGVHLQVKSAGNNQVSQEIVLLDHTFESITGDSNNHVSGSTGSTSEQVINYMLQNHLLDIDK